MDPGLTNCHHNNRESFGTDGRCVCPATAWCRKDSNQALAIVATAATLTIGVEKALGVGRQQITEVLRIRLGRAAGIGDPNSGLTQSDQR
jgi:hypothetical protein